MCLREVDLPRPILVSSGHLLKILPGHRGEGLVVGELPATNRLLPIILGRARSREIAFLEHAVLNAGWLRRVPDIVRNLDEVLAIDGSDHARWVSNFVA